MESEEKVQDLVWLEVWRQRREDLLKEAKTAQLTREIRRGRKAASREWRITLGDGSCSCEGSRSMRLGRLRRAES